MKRLLSVLLMLPSLALAAEPAAQAAPAVANTVSSGMGGQVMQLLFGLLLVVGLIFALAWVMRRVQRVGPNNSQIIELVSTRAIGPRDRLVLSRWAMNRSCWASRQAISPPCMCSRSLCRFRSGSRRRPSSLSVCWI